jgi:hypothetical protein
MALARRWRSRPQHQKRTLIDVVEMFAKGQKRTFLFATSCFSLSQNG